MSETDFAQSESGIWHLRVAEGDRLSERSEGGKLPQRKTRALATLRELKAPLRGCFGGDARGAAKGAKPHNRPRLAARRAGVPTSPVGEPSCPQGRKIKGKPRADAVELRAVQATPPSPSGEIP